MEDGARTGHPLRPPLEEADGAGDRVELADRKARVGAAVGGHEVEDHERRQQEPRRPPPVRRQAQREGEEEGEAADRRDPGPLDPQQAVLAPLGAQAPGRHRQHGRHQGGAGQHPPPLPREPALAAGRGEQREAQLQAELHVVVEPPVDHRQGVEHRAHAEEVIGPHQGEEGHHRHGPPAAVAARRGEPGGGERQGQGAGVDRRGGVVVGSPPGAVRRVAEGIGQDGPQEGAGHRRQGSRRRRRRLQPLAADGERLVEGEDVDGADRQGRRPAGEELAPDGYRRQRCLRAPPPEDPHPCPLSRRLPSPSRGRGEPGCSGLAVLPLLPVRGVGGGGRRGPG